MPDFGEVFIVEDDQLLASALAMEVELLGYRVSGLARTEVDAVAGVLASDRCIVIMDVDLGLGGSGYNAACSIRSERDDPIIFYTAYSDDEFPAQSLQLNNVQILHKPVSEEVLTRALAMATHSRQRSV